MSASHPKRVLLAEREPQRRAQLAEALGQQGYEVLSASSPWAAVELLAQHPDALVADSLAWVTLRVRQAFLSLTHRPLVLLLSDGDRGGLLGARARADGFLSRACSPAEMLARLAGLLQHAPAGV